MEKTGSAVLEPRVSGKTAAALRRSVLARHNQAGASHLGSALSIVEILTVLFTDFLDFGTGPAAGPEAAPACRDGDRLILSKGHAALALYCALAQHGHLDEAELDTYGSEGSGLEPHPNERRVDGVHASTGSLGQGMSIGLGLALGSRLRDRTDRAFVVIGDGEANEGQIWEAARCAVRLGLSNLIVILDDNGMQQDGPTPEILPVGDLPAAWEAMGWRTAACDGHDTRALRRVLHHLLAGGEDRPKLLHAATVKGKGVPFLEGLTESHYPPALTAADLALVGYMLDAEGQGNG